MAQERRSSTLPSKSIKAVDELLVGLLTCASSNSSCLPGGSVKLSPYFRASTQWRLSLELSALTVAGQWRTFTAFPFTKSGKFYTPRSFQCQSAFANNISIWLASLMALPETKACDTAESAKFRPQ